ncbi:transglycosylase family protein [Streptomyces sp. NPDC059176]|uniref:LysM peptidoglycan-binding domain-containing protein n=1 Tax=unclassified Streptomyces TaxID=2593676 RepID=UPI0036BED1CD
MLSGNGRHRRPRQAPALVVAAGVTGSAIAIPLLGAGAASAADSATWDRVADCESGGEWSADFGNGYYGGLQLTQETWEVYGGTAYAPRPDLASRAQQIAVAEMVLAAQGPSAWSNCAVITGLGSSASMAGSGSASAAQGAAESPSFGDGADEAPETGADASSPSSAPSGSGASAESSQKPASPSSAPSAAGGSASDSDGVSDADDEGGPGVDSGAGAAAEGGAGKHRGTPAEEDEAVNSGNERDSGRHASRDDVPTRDAVTTEGEYTVRPGDSLSNIADAHHVPGGWSALYSANEEVVGADPDLILPGQSLDLATGDDQLAK